MDFLQLKDQTILVSGVANKKSIAFFVAKILREELGAKVIFSVQSESQREQVRKYFPQEAIYLCDVEKEEQVTNLAQEIKANHPPLAGFLHSLAFASFSETPFHETPMEYFHQAAQISWLSLISLSRALKDHFTPNASVVTISISTTKATSYGYLGPIKAALETTVAYLAKSFSAFSQVRFNAVLAGPLKTSASAGIPHYIENYLYAEQLVLRKKALMTEEVANTICFLLSPRSSGINATGVLVDGGMNCNYFDQDLVQKLGKL